LAFQQSVVGDGNVLLVELGCVFGEGVNFVLLVAGAPGLRG
jgi:hypothetical protein